MKTTKFIQHFFISLAILFSLAACDTTWQEDIQASNKRMEQVCDHFHSLLTEYYEKGDSISFVDETGIISSFHVTYSDAMMEVIYASSADYGDVSEEDEVLYQRITSVSSNLEFSNDDYHITIALAKGQKTENPSAYLEITDKHSKEQNRVDMVSFPYNPVCTELLITNSANYTCLLKKGIGIQYFDNGKHHWTRTTD